MRLNGRDLRGTTRRAPDRAQQALREAKGARSGWPDRPRLVDRRRPAAVRGMMADMQQMEFEARGVDLPGAPFEKWTPCRVVEARPRCRIVPSTSVHARRTGRPCCAPPRIIKTVPWIDAKCLRPRSWTGPARRGVRQVPRHQARRPLPINTHLKLLLDDIIDDSRWDMTYLGMQIMVEVGSEPFGMACRPRRPALLKRLLRPT